MPATREKLYIELKKELRTDLLRKAMQMKRLI